MIIFFGGCMKDECLEDRRLIKNFIENTLPDFKIYDPYDKDWEYTNIYKEVEMIYNSDIIVFYKPGVLSIKEMHLAKNVFGKDHIYFVEISSNNSIIFSKV